MRNIRKIRGQRTPMRETGSSEHKTRKAVGFANADGNTSSTNSGSSSSTSGTQPHQWVADVKGIGDVLVNLYENIVNPILYGGGKYSGSVNIQAKQENNTMQYLIVGGVIIVALVLLLKYTKK